MFPEAVFYQPFDFMATVFFLYSHLKNGRIMLCLVASVHTSICKLFLFLELPMQFLSSDAESYSLGGGEREGVAFHFGITGSPVLLNLFPFED